MHIITFLTPEGICQLSEASRTRLDVVSFLFDAVIGGEVVFCPQKGSRVIVESSERPASFGDEGDIEYEKDGLWLIDATGSIVAGSTFYRMDDYENFVWVPNPTVVVVAAIVEGQITFLLSDFSELSQAEQEVILQQWRPMDGWFSLELLPVVCRDGLLLTSPSELMQADSPEVNAAQSGQDIVAKYGDATLTATIFFDNQGGVDVTLA